MNLGDFEQQLASLSSDFVVLSPFEKGYLHVRFIGPFNGQKTLWDAHLYTLGFYFRELKQIDQDTINCRRFFDIGDENELGRKIEIGLHLPYVDEPSLKKAMVMVRQYKRLTYGRYEYGQIIIV